MGGVVVDLFTITVTVTLTCLLASGRLLHFSI